jgi:hypothetical protein
VARRAFQVPTDFWGFRFFGFQPGFAATRAPKHEKVTKTANSDGAGRAEKNGGKKSERAFLARLHTCAFVPRVGGAQKIFSATTRRASDFVIFRVRGPFSGTHTHTHTGAKPASISRFRRKTRLHPETRRATSWNAHVRAWRGARFRLRPFLAIYDSGNFFFFSLQLQFKSVAKNATTYTHAHTPQTRTLNYNFNFN